MEMSRGPMNLTISLTDSTMSHPAPTWPSIYTTLLCPPTPVPLHILPFFFLSYLTNWSPNSLFSWSHPCASYYHHWGTNEKITTPAPSWQGVRRSWHKSKGARTVHYSSKWSSAEDLQHEPPSNEGSSAVENLVLGPCAKKVHSSALSDNRPAALTSLSMNVFERLVLYSLCPLVKPELDSVQFASSTCYTVPTAILTDMEHLLGSSSSTSPVPSTPFSQPGWGVSSLRCRFRLP